MWGEPYIILNNANTLILFHWSLNQGIKFKSAAISKYYFGAADIHKHTKEFIIKLHELVYSCRVCKQLRSPYSSDETCPKIRRPSSASAVQCTASCQLQEFHANSSVASASIVGYVQLHL